MSSSRVSAKQAVNLRRAQALAVATQAAQGTPREASPETLRLTRGLVAFRVRQVRREPRMAGALVTAVAAAMAACRTSLAAETRVTAAVARLAVPGAGWAAEQGAAVRMVAQ